MTARGLRNFNPGNIDYDPKVNWQGSLGIETGVPDPRFIRFSSAQYGIRAIAKVLLTYQNHDDCKTLRQIVSRYAPNGSENNGPAYLAALQAALKAAGLPDDPDAPINVDTAVVMNVMVRGVIIHENGSQPYTDAQISEGIRLAGVADAPPPKLSTQHTFQAQVGAGVAVVGTAATHVAQYAPTVKGWADKLSDFTGSPIIQHVQTVLLTVAGGLILLGLASQILKQRTA
jgi:hypothetical protein